MFVFVLQEKLHVIYYLLLFFILLPYLADCQLLKQRFQFVTLLCYFFKKFLVRHTVSLDQKIVVVVGEMLKVLILSSSMLLSFSLFKLFDILFAVSSSLNPLDFLKNQDVVFLNLLLIALSRKMF